MVDSSLDQALIDAYLLTEYVVLHGDRSFVLRPGEYSLELATLIDDQASPGAAFITAWNPYSRPSTSIENDAGNKALLEDLKRAGCIVIDGEGRDPSGVWPPEKSYLAIGLGRDAACELGAKHRQNAILWASADGLPELLLLA